MPRDVLLLFVVLIHVETESCALFFLDRLSVCLSVGQSGGHLPNSLPLEGIFSSYNFFDNIEKNKSKLSQGTGSKFDCLSITVLFSISFLGIIYVKIPVTYMLMYYLSLFSFFLCA